MGAVVFPSNPNINDIHNHEGISWIWDGSSWSKLFKSWSFSDQNDYLYYNTDNVGIGTTSPDTILEVVGSDPILTIRDTSTGEADVNAKLRLAETDANDTLGKYWDIQYLASDLNFSYNGNPFMHIDYQGKVGIGTTSPQTKLHLNHGETSVNGPQELLRLQGDWNGATGVDGDGALIRFTNQHNSATNPNTGEYNVAGIAGLDDSSNWGGSLHFQTSPTGGNGGNNLQTRMVVKYDGKVGIGTTDPDCHLHTYSSSNSTINMIKASNHLGVAVGLIAYQNSHAEIRVGTDHDLLFKTNDNNERMRITNDGKVSFGGITSPTDRFEVEVHTGEALRIVNTAGTMRGYFGRKVSGEGHLGIFDASSNERIHLDTTAHSYFTGAGNVGIGTYSPAEKLEVSGAIKLGTTSSTNPGTIRWSGTDFEGYDGASWNSLTTGGSASPWTTSSNDIYYDSGEVGIGTNNPSAPLHVVVPSTSAGGIYAGVFENLSSEDGSQHGVKIIVEPNGGYPLAISNDSGATNNCFSILNNGRVGIGTLPSYELHVRKDQSATTNIVLQNHTVNTSSNAQIFVETKPSAGDPQIQFQIDGTEAYSVGIDNSDSDKFKISDFGTLGTNDRLVIDSSGNVDVGNFRIEQDGNGSHLEGVSSIAFRNTTNTWASAANHGIMSTDQTGAFTDDISINTYHDLSIRLDTNDNHSDGYLRIYKDTTTSSSSTLSHYFGHNTTGLNVSYMSGNVGINTSPTTNSYRLNMGGSIHMNNNTIDYVTQLHFNDNVRFLDEGNNKYLRFKWGNAGEGGIKFIDGDDNVNGAVYGSDSGFGLVSQSWDWAVRIYPDGETQLYYDGSEKLNTTSTGVNITGNLVTTGSAGIYTNGWFRNNHSDEGLYNEANLNHFYSSTSQYWHMTAKSDQTFGGLVFYKGHNDGTAPATNRKGSVYWSSAGFGLLDNDGSWAFRTVGNEAQLFYDGSEKLNTTSTGVNITGNLSVSGGFQGSFQNNPTVTTTSGYEAPGSEISHVVAPSGASIRGNSSETGAIKITLPHSWTNTMLYIKVRIYEYDDAGPGQSGQNVLYGNNSVEVHAAGYNNDGGGGTWVQTTAFTHKSGMSMKNVDYNVRFGHDGSKCCIYIGDSDTDWVYPQVAVIDGTFGYVGYDTEDWSTGWDVSFTTSIQNVGATIFTGKRVNFFKDLTIRTQGVNGTSVYGPSGTSPLNYTVANFADFKDSPYRYYEKIEVYSQNGLETILIDDLISANPTASTVFRIRYDDDELADDQMYFYFSGDDLILKQSSAPANTQYKIYRIDVVKD